MTPINPLSGAAGEAEHDVALPCRRRSCRLRRIPDPIYAAIEAHRAAAIETSAVHALFAAFETELQANGRLQSERRTGEENRRQDELDILRNDAFDAECGFACDILNTSPTTLAGVVALLYVRDHDEKEIGMGFPNDLQAGSFQALLIANLAEDLPELMREAV